jgi:Flp pilus assembly CpaE family ATPase
LAAKLAQFFPDNSVCLVDMNKPMSIGRAMLNIEDTYSWLTLQPLLQEGSVSKQKIANIVYLTKYRFSLLSGPTTLGTKQSLTLKEFKNLDSSLKKIFKVVIYDFHTIENKETISYLSQSDMLLIVADATSASMLQMIRGISFMREENLDLLHSFRYILNKIDEQHGKSADLIASRLEITPFGVIDNDPEAVSTYIENGQLFEDKTLLLNRQLYTLAEAVVRELF